MMETHVRHIHYGHALFRICGRRITVEVGKGKADETARAVGN